MVIDKEYVRPYVRVHVTVQTAYAQPAKTPPSQHTLHGAATGSASVLYMQQHGRAP